MMNAIGEARSMRPLQDRLWRTKPLQDRLRRTMPWQYEVRRMKPMQYGLRRTMPLQDEATESGGRRASSHSGASDTRHCIAFDQASG